MSDKRSFGEFVADLKRSRSELRGSLKLRGVLDVLGIDPAGRICLDVGASTGGFTTVLLERGAARVYAVDAGHGQLLGSLRQDARVVNLERTNVGELTSDLVGDLVGLVTVDVSYLPLREAVSQLDRVGLTPDSELVGLVKPMFELALPTAPADEATLGEATALAVAGIESAGWDVVATVPSAMRGAGGAIEGFVHARRR